MMFHKIKNGYQVADCLYQLINEQVIPDLDIEENSFWSATADILKEFTPRNKSLLALRETLQSQIDQWHLDLANKPFNQTSYQAFLKSIDYIVDEGKDFIIETDNIDPEVGKIAGPQLVVPLMNARFALNAANARWGSLYDALYGSNIIDSNDGAEAGKTYNPIRGIKVQTYGRNFLDATLPLKEASHSDVSSYHIIDQQLQATLSNGSQTSLMSKELLVGYNGSVNQPTAILFCHHGLHIEIVIDKQSVVGKTDSAGVADIIMEAAVTTIQDCEDSIAAVDAEDKTLVYSNWLGLMKGDLTENLEKSGDIITRKLKADRNFISPSGKNFSLTGRSLLFIRNVGHLMTTDCILTADNDEVPEGIVDGIITSLIALHDIKGNSQYKNSPKGNIYIVKPKMHGPEEVKFTDDLFCQIEKTLDLNPNTIKLGIMDEERRTSVNLKECIRAAKNRVAFINTGFLDRTGDEIHCSMQAGPIQRKELIKDEKWIAVYEKRNVDIGLETGFKGVAQIGKGMWAIPDDMKGMMKDKVAHPLAGANCAWVPSPTAAVLHAIHYHEILVAEVQAKHLENRNDLHREDELQALLTIPLLNKAEKLSVNEIQHEIDNNIQGLLGYVVRWIHQGIGCSKVPDINDIGRMEDRATLRISSQHLCNWLHHNIINNDQVISSLKRMAKVVDQQNESDLSYVPFYSSDESTDIESNLAFIAASELIFKGKEQPSGYTEPLLHARRKNVKANN